MTLGPQIALTGLVVLFLMVVMSNLLDLDKRSEGSKVFLGFVVILSVLAIAAGLVVWVWL